MWLCDICISLNSVFNYTLHTFPAFLELSISLRCQTCFWIMLPGFCLNLDQCDSAGRAGYVQITGFSQVKHAVLQLFHSCSIIISSVCFVTYEI